MRRVLQSYNRVIIQYLHCHRNTRNGNVLDNHDYWQQKQGASFLEFAVCPSATRVVCRLLESPGFCGRQHKL